MIVIPTAGSSSLVEFKVNKAINKIVKIKSDKYKIPFGARVVDSRDKTLGITDQSGFVFISKSEESEKEDSKWKVVWSSDEGEFECLLKPEDMKKELSISTSQVNVNCY